MKIPGITLSKLLVLQKDKHQTIADGKNKTPIPEVTNLWEIIEGQKICIPAWNLKILSAMAIFMEVFKQRFALMTRLKLKRRNFV